MYVTRLGLIFEHISCRYRRRGRIALRTSRTLGRSCADSCSRHSKPLINIQLIFQLSCSATKLSYNPFVDQIHLWWNRSLYLNLERPCFQQYYDVLWELILEWCIFCELLKNFFVYLAVMLESVTCSTQSSEHLRIAFHKPAHKWSPFYVSLCLVWV